MSSINFYLDKPDRKNKCPIILSFQDKGKKFRFYTKQKIESSNWRNQRVKSQCASSLEINTILKDYENIISGIIRKAIFNKQSLSVVDVRNKFESEIGHIKKLDFFGCYETFIQLSKSTRKSRTIQAYESTKKKLIEFQKDTKQTLTFSDINLIFYNQFVRFLIKKGLLNNSIGKHIKVLKTFLNFCIDNNYTQEKISLKGFKVFNEENDVIHLTNEELLKVYNLDGLPDRLQKVRDVFCFSCFTGLRFSDVDKLSHSHIKPNFVELRAEKTKDFVKVPFNTYSRAIIEKYKANERPLPTGITNQKTNDYLKEICQLAGLDNIIHVEKFKGAEKLDIRKPKWQMISTHTARRTFVTLALEKGIRAEIVMAMTGHKSYRTFKKYIKVTDNVMQIEMQRLWNQPIMKIV
jgi:site-specific recombinase XerD